MNIFCSLLIVVFLVLCVTAATAAAVYGESIEVITGRGNVFVLDYNVSTPDGTSTGHGTSMLDGIGINSRLVHQEYKGNIIHGAGLYGAEQSIRPYNDIGANTEFVIAALDSDDPQDIIIPEFYHRYHYGNGTLLPTSAESPNVLGYTGLRQTSGNVIISTGDGVTISGQGRAILEVPDYLSQRIILTGNLSDGTVIRLVESPYDLMTQSYHATKGFLVNYCTCNPTTNSFNVLVGTTDDSAKSAVFQYEQSASASVCHGKCCKGRYTASASHTQTVTASLIVQPDQSGRYLAVLGDNTNPELMTIYDVMRPGAKLFRTNYNVVENFEHRIYDTLPVAVSRTFSGTFEDQLVFPSKSYLIIDSAGGQSKIRGTTLDQRNFVEITGLSKDTGYRLTRDGRTLVSGITTHEGTITIRAFGDNTFSGFDGKLYLYDNSLAYHHTNSSSTNTTVSFDHVNGVTIPLHLAENRIYNIHAYVKIPVVGAINITGVSLDKKLFLEHLDGAYRDAQSIFVPVIPTYKRIHLNINGVDTSIGVADVLGSTGLHIADPVSNTITLNRPDDFTHTIESTAGVVTYMIATHDGNAKAHVQDTVSGWSEITNTREYTKNPPLPPPPRPRDPLTTWVEVYINGILQSVSGQERTQIFFSDIPTEDHYAKSSGVSSTHTARFSYPEVRVFDTISVPVNAADFVEFYFYNQIRAEGSIPPVPSGYTEYKRHSSASATATLGYASINTSM